MLTPSGATDETTSSDGSELTEVIGAAATTASSCEVLLMEYSFGYSYGVPFVGKLGNHNNLHVHSANLSQQISHHQHASSIESP